MKRKYHAPRTAPLIVVLVMAVAAVTLLVCVGTFLQSYRAAVVQSARTSSAQAVSQVVGTVSNYVQNLEGTINDVMAEMDTPEESRDAYLNAWLNARSEVVAVTTYDSEGNLQDCWALEHTPRSEILKNLSFNLSMAQWYTEGYISSPHVESIFEGYYPWVVTVVRPMPQGSSASWVAVDVRFSGLGASINGVGIGQHGYCYLMDEHGNMVYHPQQQLLYAGIKSEEVARLANLADGTYVEDTVIYSLQDVPDSNWRVVGVSYIDETVNESFWQMVRIALATSAMILAAALLAGWIISRLLSRPLQQLETAMEQFEQDADGFTYEPVAGTREVQELSDSFGHMVGRIQKLMTTVREEEIDLRKTELKALQAQINPHFLYNTLDSIAWMCERGKNADAVKMVHALARLFRISISRGHELIPIEKELQHAESYLLIQKFRYKNQFTYHFTVDESCLHCLCNKITLQPIIENSITHGLDLLVDPGHIEIEVCADGEDILFKVTDDGIGMSQEQVAELLKNEPSDRTGIGIKNVNDRLRIYFGPQYGMSIDSVPDEGTTVTIRMPRVPEDREGDYDKTH
ncbi:MAG TPA: sensor histidine kinase [Candidatus Gemmiger excrementigallinarum]|uniref:histidine kinase n=1 Tax=Candidatus Gemmiger excrementigallinarum TaxID=2838609 RepID=A0A9D2ET58_9FIRM|nr:sensor histidine kinase [Candidatus Gemmiger excrementigallinarum]